MTQPHVPPPAPASGAEPLRPAPTCWPPSAAAFRGSALPAAAAAAAGTAHDIPPAAEPPRGAALAAAGLPRPAGGERGGQDRPGRGRGRTAQGRPGTWHPRGRGRSCRPAAGRPAARMAVTWRPAAAAQRSGERGAPGRPAPPGPHCFLPGRPPQV